MRLELDPKFGKNMHVINKKGKGKLHPITGHRGPEVLDGGWVVNAMPGPVYPWKDPVPIV